MECTKRELQIKCSRELENECLVTQLSPTLCDPMDYSPQGSSVHGIFQARNTVVDCHFLLQEIFPSQGQKNGEWGIIWNTLVLEMALTGWKATTVSHISINASERTKSLDKM